MTTDNPTAGNADEPVPPKAAGNGNNRGRNRALLIAGLFFLLCAIAAGIYWWLNRDLESTDDAFIQADVVQVAPRVSGTVAKVLVRDNEHVQANQLLVRLDPSDYQAALAQAKANLAATKANHSSSERDAELTRQTGHAGILRAKAALASARAQAAQARNDLARYQKLHAKDEVSQQRLDQARTTADTANAQLRQARAELTQAQTAPQQLAVKKARAESTAAGIAQARSALKQAQLNLSYTQIRAPQAGKIARKNVLPGSRVAAGQAMMAVVADDPWVVANFKETQLTRMRPGQPVTIEIDAYPNREFHGHVDSIQSGTGAAFSLLPPQNASGNFVKVVQRVPVKILFDDLSDPKQVIAPGMSVVPTVNVAPSAGITDTADPDQTDFGHPKGT